MKEFRATGQTVVRRLGDICEFASGGTPSSAVPQYWGDGTPWITGADIADGRIKRPRSHVTAEGIRNSATRAVPCGTPLLVTRTTVGKVAVANRKICFSQDITALLYDKEVLHCGYLVHFLRTKEAHFRSLQRGATIKGITRDAVAGIMVPLPPLAEQKRIAAILDKADEIRRKQREAQKLATEFERSLFLEMFGSEIQRSESTPLGELVEEFRYGTSEKSSGAGFPTLTIPNILHGEVNTAELKRVPVTDREFARLALRDGDILFVRTNGNPNYVGRSAVFDVPLLAETGFATDQFIFASYLIRARVKTGLLHPVFLHHYLLTPVGLRSLRDNCRTSAGQYNINTQGLAAIPIPVVGISRQERFASIAAACNGSRLGRNAGTRICGQLFDSLIHHAFNGAIL